MGSERKCLDGIKCVVPMGFCAEDGCWRVRKCKPLSGVFEQDKWPDIEELARMLAQAREEAEGLAAFIDEQFSGESVLDDLPWRSEGEKCSS